MERELKKAFKPRVLAICIKQYLLGGRRVGGDKYSVEYDIPDSITAPVSNGDAVGKVYVKYNDEVVFEEDMISIDNVDNIDLKFMLDNILNKWYA